jgi:hypothetical protein
MRQPRKVFLRTLFNELQFDFVVRRQRDKVKHWKVTLSPNFALVLLRFIVDGVSEDRQRTESGANKVVLQF